MNFGYRIGVRERCDVQKGAGLEFVSSHRPLKQYEKVKRERCEKEKE